MPTPSEPNYQSHADSALSPPQQNQAKSCPSCKATIFFPELDAPATCPNCREQVLLRAAHSQNNSRRLIDQDISHLQPPRDVSSNLHNMRHPLVTTFESPPSPVPLLVIPSPRIDPSLEFSKPLNAPVSHSQDPPIPPTTKLTFRSSHSVLSDTCRPHPCESQQKPPITQVALSTPDPLTDVTHLRVRTRGNRCLYPGATFEGTQKSGRNSYDVTVTIVDVDFSTSFLCGYLCIRGLTEDWPELTTYFDAEIIGSRYGFLTQNWGASENEDLVHWGRFPAFRHIKHEAKRPRLTMDDRDRGAVFMRWKEKFLVPDHRVHDINGASFAGFYYVCVDFNPAATASANAACDVVEEEQRNGRKQHRNRRASSAHRISTAKRPPSLAPYTAPVATMSGFYYHQNSEPYQQLSLTHEPEVSCSSFEFR